ncbi:protein involved in polysaccharide export with SLBB domain [Amorphus sp. MBR-141]
MLSEWSESGSLKKLALAMIGVLAVGACGQMSAGRQSATGCVQPTESRSPRVVPCSGTLAAAGRPAPIVPTAYADPGLATGFRPWNEGVASEFRFVIGDEVTINLPFYEEESATTQVAPDGRIYLSLIGSVVADGRTPKELEQELEERYRKYLRFPTVGVVPKSFGSRQVFVGGEVERPGALSVPGPLGVMEAVIMAGGLKDTAGLRKIVLIRRSPDDQPMMRIVDLDQFTDSAAPAENVILQPYDIVFVPRSTIAEVNLWVDQFINKTVPFSRGFSYTIQKTVY